MWYRRTPETLPACYQRLSFIGKPLGKDSEVMASRGLTPFTEGHRLRQVGVFFPQSDTPVTPKNSFLSGKEPTLPLEPGTKLRQEATNARAPARITQRTPSFPLPGSRPRRRLPAPRLASSVSRRGISIDPRDMMATPLSAEPPPRNGPSCAHFPSQTPTDPDVLGPRAGGGGLAPPPRRNQPIPA